MAEVTIPTLDGMTFSSLISFPAGDVGPGLIIIRGLFSQNASLIELAERYASLGYIAICPNIFHRQNVDPEKAFAKEPDFEQTSRLYKSFDVEAGVRDLLATLAYVRRLPQCGGKVGALGYCLGSRLAYLMATRSDVDCAVGYYGVGIESMLDEVYDIRMPLLLHFAENDKLLTPTTRMKMLSTLAKNPCIKSFLYPGVEHGFAREGSMTYNAAAASLSNERTELFLRETLLV